MTLDLARHFGLDGTIWMNTAHQGALPHCAAREAMRAIHWKLRPTALTANRFAAVPARLRRALATFIGAPEDEIALANSASYGLHLLANALPWHEGDEVLVMATDFPSDILPWLTLEARHGIIVRRLHPADVVVSPDELCAAITARTRLFCTTWVHSFSGHTADLDGLGEVCRAHGVLFVVNASQAIGARVLQVSRHPIDALTAVGFKWLCGPYGTGFCWMSSPLLDRLQRTQAYWLSMLSAEDLAGDLGDLSVDPINSAADFDVFGTASFFNVAPFAAAVELLNSVGLRSVEEHDQALVEGLIEACATTGFHLVSPREWSARRSTLVVLSHSDPTRVESLRAALSAAGIHAAMRAGAIRLSPHLYNSLDQIRAVGDVLRDVSRDART